MHQAGLGMSALSPIENPFYQSPYKRAFLDIYA